MEYTLLNELMAIMRLRELERIDLRRIAEAEALAPRAGLRQTLASALVRVGVSLDHGAGERALAAAGARAAR
ncbi:MAG: hypothetical protein KGK07_12505 [Chloroflexota bacterium]|nr:hypothetical protein [Chloroflexota bacterium]